MTVKINLTLEDDFYIKLLPELKNKSPSEYILKLIEKEIDYKQLNKFKDLLLLMRNNPSFYFRRDFVCKQMGYSWRIVDYFIKIGERRNWIEKINYRNIPIDIRRIQKIAPKHNCYKLTDEGMLVCVAFNRNV